MLSNTFPKSYIRPCNATGDYMVFRTLLLSYDIVFTGVLTIVVLPLQDGKTALMVASKKGHEVVVEALLKAGTTVDMQSEA